MRTLLKNVRTVVTCNDADEVLSGTDVWLRDGVIERIGHLDASADAVFDAGSMLLYPGLVNTHHHLYQYFTRNLPSVQGLELFDWLRALYEIWKYINEDTVRLSSLCGMAELMRYGCTTCFDHHYVFPKDGGDLIAAQFDAAAALGIRMHASRGSMDLSVKDGGLPPDSVVQDVDAILRDCERLAGRFHDPGPLSMRRVVFAPCSPFSVSETLLRTSVDLARRLGVRLHTHLCETRDEERYTLERYGLRPLAYMETLGWTGSDVFYAHGIHFDDAELDTLALTGTGVAHCPCSNMKLHSGVARVPDMLRRGIAVGLAVDGSASNDAGNLLEEMRAAYLLHRHTYGEAAPDGYALLKMATRGGAALLGQPSIGCIAEGMAADLFLIRADSTDLVCATEDVRNLFGTVGYHRPCDLMFVNGVLTVKDGVCLGIDEPVLQERAAREVARLLSLS